MSGAVQTVGKVAEKALDIYTAPTQAIKKAVVRSGVAGEEGNKFIGNWNSEAQYWQKGAKAVGEGKGVSGFISGTAGSNFKDTKGQVGSFMSMINPGEPPPATIVAEDPAVVADKANKEKARAKRQAEIDILTNTPGRGGTILTDQYTYNV